MRTKKLRSTEALSITLDRKLYAALNDFAAKQGLPRSRILNTLIERSLERWEKTPARAEATI